MALHTPTTLGPLVGPGRRLITIALDVVVGVVALPAFWVMEALALDFFLPLVSASMTAWMANALSIVPCLIWLMILVALARRGQTPASIVTRQRWVDATGKPLSWGPLGSIAFWIAATPVLFMVVEFCENFFLLGAAYSWDLLPPFANINAGVQAACLMIIAIALPPYLRFRRQSVCVRRTAG